METMIEQFQNQIRQGKLSHAYLLTGNNYAYKQRLTTTILQALICRTPNPVGSACEQCVQCQRVENQQFADFMIVRPEGQSIKVDQIRQLKEWLSSSPIESDFKLAVIESAELMNASSSNALLTFLEEPVDNVYILLYATEASTILQTIRSRTQQIHLQESPIETKVEQLSEYGIPPHHAAILSHFSSDSLHYWQEHYEGVQFELWLKGLATFYQMLLKGDAAAFVTIQVQLRSFLSVQQARDGLDYMIWLTHQLLRQLQLTMPAATQAYLIENMMKDCQPTTQHLLSVHRHLLEAKQRLEANVNPQLSYEYLVVRLCQWR